MTCNFELLHKKISMLMKERHLSQTELAKKMGVKQPRVSQALRSEAGSRFTIDEYMLIAEEFNMTLGELFSLADTPSSEGLTIKDVCKMLSEIYNSDLGFKFHSVDVTEAVYEKETEGSVTSYVPHSAKNVYLGIYFSRHFQVSEDEQEDIIATNFGNNSACGYINEFLVKLQQLSETCDAGIIDRKSYNEQIERYIKELPDISDEKIKIPVWLT